MHSSVFKSEHLFSRLYRPSLYYIFSRIVHCQDAVESLCHDTMTRFYILYANLIEGEQGAKDFHAGNLVRYRKYWSNLFSNTTCLCCLRCPPEYVLPCGHALCERCMRLYGEDCSFKVGRFDSISFETCVICGNDEETIVTMKPVTSGVRLLSIDGGGIKGIVPLETLNLLQKSLGESVMVQELFDLTLGTSAGE